MINGQPVPALNLIVNTQETSAAGVTGPDGRVVFSGLPAGQYFIQGYGAQGRGFAQVAVADPGSVTARFAILPEWATSFPLADGARLAPAGGPPLQIDAITSVSGAPGTAASLNSVTRVRLENGGRYGASGEPVYDQSVTNVSVRITGPAATRFLNCQPACTQVQVPDASAVQFTVGSIDPFGGSGMLTATFVGGTASAGNLGPNTVTVTWTLDGRTQSYTVNLGQGVGR
jgi:hypothetical protein